MPPDVLDRLITRISAGQVIPVIGDGLLETTTATGTRFASDVIAEAVANRLDMPSTAALGTLSDLAHDYLSRDRKSTLEGFREVVAEVVQEITWQPSESLQQLASVSGFRVILTTGCDPLVSQALAARDRLAPAIGGFTTNGVDKDLPIGRDRRVVYHLFGAADALTRFAVTEEDLLETLLQLQAHAPSLPSLGTTLQQAHLLLLGCSYPDWLTRLFLRIARQKRLGGERDEAEYLPIAKGEQAGSGLVRFLERFSARTTVLPMSPSEMVAGLADRWATHRPAGVERVGGVELGAIFLSYAREDRAMAEALHAALTAEGLDAWLDKSEHPEALRPGDGYRERIRERIAGAELFVPLMSRAAAERAEGFYRLEWDWAMERGRLIAPDVPFLLPVRVDEVPYDHAGIPRAVREVDWADTATVGIAGVARSIRDAVRAVRARRHRGAA